MKRYFGNAFSLQMVTSFPCNVEIEEVVDGLQIDLLLDAVKDGSIMSAVGHQDTAAVLGVPMNRINVTLGKGDILFVAQLQGGRLPEGSTTLPEGFSFKFLQVTIK
jgi:hypothetical protein